MEIKFKSIGLWGRYALKQGNPLQNFKTLILLYLFYLSLYFWLTVSNKVSKAIFLDIKFKVLAYEEATAWNRGIPGKILNILIKLYLVLLNGSKRLSEVRSFEIKWICRPIRQIQPETGKYLVFFFQNKTPIIFVTFISLFFYLLYQRGSQR